MSNSSKFTVATTGDVAPADRKAFADAVDAISKVYCAPGSREIVVSDEDLPGYEQCEYRLKGGHLVVFEAV